ncbi:hypothetical protein AN958_08711 [Leucoagaricus sp. SymC.cos]|nr:hypothetical protein AN958_08711 [Leucoagaricus sp. SymC.cos]
MTFVQTCLRRNDFSHLVARRQAMGGSVGRQRVNFSKEDDDNLCWYISRRIPYVEDGGRLSVGIYEELVNGTGLAWAKRHPPASWLERYRKNRPRLDPVIERYSKKFPPEPPALYGLSRKCNRNPGRALRFIEHNDDVIEITDESAPEEDLQVNSKSQRRSRSAERRAKPSKRRRIESPKGPSSSPAARRRKDIRRTLSPADRPSVEPSPPKKERKGKRTRSPQVPRASTSPSIRRVNLATVATHSSPRPSTSFRNVAHSSPAHPVSKSASRSGVRSHDTSATEPSSRSLVVPLELANPQGNATTAPAESSITRESSHKPSSPIPQPMRKASRKVPLRQPPVPPSSGEDEEEEEKSQQQESQWAPYKNTRSRSRSVEPVHQSKKRRRKEKENGRKTSRDERLLEPVHESEVEREQDSDMEVVTQEVEAVDAHQGISAATTETMQDEQNVAELLMANADETISGTLSGVSTGQVEGSDEEEGNSERETEEDGEGEQRTYRRMEEGEETQEAQISEDGEDEDETARFEKAPDDADDAPRTTSPRDSSVEISSDDEAVQQRFLPQSHTRRRRQSPSDSDDEESDNLATSTPAKTAQEVLAMFDSSPEVGTSRQQVNQPRKPFNTFRSGSPSPLRVQNQNRPRQSLPAARSSQVVKSLPRVSLPPAARAYAKVTPLHQAAQKLTESRRVSFGGGSSSPSSVGSLPRTPILNPLPTRAFQAPSSLRSSVALSQTQIQSQSRRRRRGSVDSTTSSVVTFPIGGTRASAVRQQMEQALKESPYTPPTGTKAHAQVLAETSMGSRHRKQQQTL